MANKTKSVLTSDVKIKGNITEKGSIIIDGEVEGNINATKNITMGGDLTVGGFASWSGSIVATTKLFDIEHPTKGEGYRLAHACLEGPEHGVYHRGRLKNEKVIRKRKKAIFFIDFTQVVILSHSIISSRSLSIV